MKHPRVCARSLFFCGLPLLFLSLAPQPVTAENSLKVGTASATDGNVADVPLILNCLGDVQAFVMCFEWDGSKATGVDLLPKTGAGEVLASADLVVKRVEAAYMVYSVVMDADGKDGEKIPAAQDIGIGTAKIRCNGPASGSRQVDISLVDDKYATVDGGPLLANIITIGGETLRKGDGLTLRNGALTCDSGEPSSEVVFACGGPLGDDGKPTAQKGRRESIHAVNFYYKSPGTGAGNKNKIQGLSMSVKFATDLTALPESFSLEGGALKEVNAEFVHLEVDNLNGDGDPCEFTLGVLVDAVAPYDGRTLPSTSAYRKLFSLSFQIEDDADCGDCMGVDFVDGLTGNGEVPVYNVASINFFPQIPQLVDCDICVDQGAVKFVRGDCNFTFGGKRAVDVSDAAAMVGFIFLEGDAHFDAPCKDACDSNDDGRLDAGDIVFILNYLFVPQSPFPPPPGPTTPGFDPTNDNLDCAGGTLEC